MRPQKLAATTAGWLLAGSSLFGQPRPVADVLCHPGEATVFSFLTKSGKTVSLCEGPKGAYLVYRFGTAAKIELQYPAVLDASSWQKFTYWAYHRGGGVANAGMELHQLSFKNKGVEYQLYQDAHAFINKAKQEDSRHEVGVYMVLKGKEARIVGRESSIVGSLYLADDQRARVKESEQP
jgi:hypothetical protein